MNESEALTEISRMSMDEKIAALSPTEKAYISGYIDRAVLDAVGSVNNAEEQRGEITNRP